MDGAKRDASVRRLDEFDWDFADQASHSAFSDIHWHPCRFPSQVPAIAIERLTQPGEWVIDPFLGSGTTMVEAQRLGRPSTGIDVNPIATLIADSKTLNAPAKEIARFIEQCIFRLRAGWEDSPRIPAPASVQMDKWYTPNTQIGLERLWWFVSNNEGPFNVVLKSAFSAILMPSCRETRHWGYICDNVMPKSERERDVRQLFIQTLKRLAAAYCERDGSLTGRLVSASILLGDSRQMMQTLPSDVYSLAVTSPPYAGVADYVKSQRLSMEWFGLDILMSRKDEIGARFKRNTSGSEAKYVLDLEAVYSELFRVLRPGGWAVIVYGQSPARAPAKVALDEAIARAGFVTELEKVRQISEGRRQYPSLRDEFVIILRKP